MFKYYFVSFRFVSGPQLEDYIRISYKPMTVLMDNFEAIPPLHYTASLVLPVLNIYFNQSETHLDFGKATHYDLL